jgi:hypothetical protein
VVGDSDTGRGIAQRTKKYYCRKMNQHEVAKLKTLKKKRFWCHTIIGHGSSNSSFLQYFTLLPSSITKCFGALLG